MINLIKKQILEKIKENKEDLLNSHLKYGGVYIAQIEEDYHTFYEVELNEGTISFSIKGEEGACLNCGHKEFSARQKKYMDIVVDGNNSWIRNQSEEATDAENPYGPYECLNCEEEYDDLENELHPKNIYNILHETLKEEGIGVYQEYYDFENALFKSDE